jgi:Camelysin metallo-endopeptidase
MTATTASRGRTARKVLGSLGVIGAAAAVAGMGTFGTFTDSTAPLNASVTSGTLSLDLNATNSTASLPMNATGFVPGDSISRSVDLANTGNLAFAGIFLNSTATTSSPLDTDKINGLQLSVKSCPVAWTETLTNGVASYACSGTATTVIASGPAVSSATPTGLTSLNAGGTDHLVVTLALPAGADNTFQGKTSALSISFTGTQKTGTNR